MFLAFCDNYISERILNTMDKKKVTFRSYKNFNEAELNEELSRVPFHVAHIFDDMDHIY